MKKVIYSIITDDVFGIKVKDDMKLNILRILDQVKTKVSIMLNEPILVSNNEIEKFNLSFITFDNDELFGLYKITNKTKTFRISLLPTLENPNMIEDYMIMEHDCGLIEYKTRYVYKNNNNYSKNEYYYNGEEITEEEACDLLNPKTK